MMECVTTTAWKVAGDPELYHLVWQIGNGKTEWECTGVNKTMDRVRFVRIISTDTGDTGLRQITIYVPPGKLVRSYLTYD